MSGSEPGVNADADDDAKSSVKTNSDHDMESMESDGVSQARERLEQRCRGGDREALAALFAQHAQSLLQWLENRLSPRLSRRVSAADVLQEVFLAAEARCKHWEKTPDMPFAVWIKLIAQQCVTDVHRRHQANQGRSVSREIPLDAPGGGGDPKHGGDASDGGAGRGGVQLAGDLTSPSRAAMRHETRDLLVSAINRMEPIDREVLVLRHFQELSNDEVALKLQIPKSTASKRYVRALARLRLLIEEISGLNGSA